MKKTLTKNFLFLLVFIGVSNFSFAQINGSNDKPVAVLGVIQTNNGSNGDGPYKLNDDCELEIDLVTVLANIDLYSTPENGVYPFPEDHPPMYLAYSIDNGLIQYQELTSFKHIGIKNGIDIFANTTSIYVNFDEECSKSEKPSVIVNTYLVTPENGNPQEGFEQYPACNYISKFELFSCKVQSITSCQASEECNQSLLTSGSDYFRVSCGKCKDDSNNNFVQQETDIQSENEKGFDNNETVVFPNPFSNEIIISLPIDEVTNQISLIDINGKEVQAWGKNQINGSDKFKIHTDHLPKGIYFLKVANLNSFKTLKLVKQ